MMGAMAKDRGKSQGPGKSGRCAPGAFALTGLLAAAAAALPGCDQPSKETVQQLEQARVALDSRRFAECERLLDPIITDYNRRGDTALALYMRAQCRLLTNRQKAQRDLVTAQPLAKDKLLRAYIDVQLGNIAFDDGVYVQAAAQYAEALDKLPDSPPTDRVLYQYGLALQRSDRFDKAREVFAQVARAYPASKYAVAARQKQAWAEEYFAVQCGVFNEIDFAHRTAARLREQGINAVAFPEERGGGKRYVVRVGRFPRYADACRELDRVRQVQEDAFIVP